MRRQTVFLVLVLSSFLATACNKPNDDFITTQIKAKMFSEPSLKSASVSVASKDGIVTLTGVVPAAARTARETRTTSCATKTSAQKEPSRSQPANPAANS